MDRYDRTFSRYDAGWGPDRYAAWYPGAFWAGAPVFGWGWGAEVPPFTPYPPYGPYGFGGPAGYERDFRPRQRPEQSPTYGDRGDEAARRYARRRGYDEGYAIQPRRPERPRRR